MTPKEIKKYNEIFDFANPLTKSISDAHVIAEHFYKQIDNTIQDKINELLEITDNFLFLEYYSHTGKEMWKINNQFTHYNTDTLVLCERKEGIERALDLAIEFIIKKKKTFFDDE